ncbi:MAG: MFS transporter [Anaerovoracaceae bacterium]
MNFLTQYKGLPKQIYLLSISRAVISMGMMFIFPFMSLLLTTRLGYSTVEAGYIMVVTAIANMLGSLIGGKMADDIGRKKVYGLFTIIVVFAMTLGGIFCYSRIVVICVVLAYFSVSAIMPVVSAMIIDWSDNTNKTECFSLLYLASNVGGSIGPIIAGLLFYNHMPLIFFGMALAFSVTFIIILIFIKDIYVPQPTLKQNNKKDRIKEKSLIRIVIENPILLTFIICLAILTICYIELDYMLPLQLSDYFGLNAGSKYSSLIWVINGILCVVLTPILVSITKKNHQLLNIGVACILYAVGFSLYAFNNNIVVFMVAVAVWTAGEILISTGAGVYISNQSPDTHKGRCMSLYEFSRGVGKCLGPVLCGYFLVSHTYGQTWLVIAGLCIITDVVIWILYKKS